MSFFHQICDTRQYYLQMCTCHVKKMCLNGPWGIKTSSVPQDPFVFESGCLFKVDEFGFFLTWKSDGKVQAFLLLFKKEISFSACNFQALWLLLKDNLYEPYAIPICLTAHAV